MENVVVCRKKPLWKRLKWHNIFTLILVIVALSIAVWHVREGSDYEIKYIPYRMQENDTLFNIVQDKNSFVPWGWDAHDFVSLTKKVNHIEDVSQIQAGQTILIPIAEPKKE